MIFQPIRQKIKVGEQYKDPGFKAKDKDGKNITPKVKIDGGVDTNNAATYYVYYDVVDDYGIAAATVYRIVYVEDGTTADAGDGVRPMVPGTVKSGEFRQPGISKAPQKSPSIVKWKGMPPATATTQVTPPKLPPGVISAAPQTKKTTRVYYEVKSPPIGSTVNKATSVKLPPGGISAKPGVASPSATQPADEKK